MDIFLRVRKFGVDGAYLPIHCMRENFPGAWGQPAAPAGSWTKSSAPIFRLFWPTGRTSPWSRAKSIPSISKSCPTVRIWHKGETLNVHISPEFMDKRGSMDANAKYVTDNGEPGQANTSSTPADSMIPICRSPCAAQVHRRGVRVQRIRRSFLKTSVTGSALPPAPVFRTHGEFCVFCIKMTISPAYLL